MPDLPEEKGGVHEDVQDSITKDRIERKKIEEEAKIAEELLRRAEEQLEHRKILETAENEFAKTGDEHMLFERILLMVGAGILVLSLPFFQVLNGIVLTIFTVAVVLIAGFTSPKRSYSPHLNLIVSVLGLLYFEGNAIAQFHLHGSTGYFILYQLLGFDFLIASYFSTVTFRQKVLDAE